MKFRHLAELTASIVSGRMVWIPKILGKVDAKANRREVKHLAEGT